MKLCVCVCVYQRFLLSQGIRSLARRHKINHTHWWRLVFSVRWVRGDSPGAAPASGHLRGYQLPTQVGVRRQLGLPPTGSCANLHRVRSRPSDASPPGPLGEAKAVPRQGRTRLPSKRPASLASAPRPCLRGTPVQARTYPLIYPGLPSSIRGPTAAAGSTSGAVGGLPVG